MGVDPERVERIVDRAEYVEESLLTLAEKQDVERQEYVDRSDLGDVVERRFETMTQACIDIGRVLLTDLDAPQPEANRDVVEELARAGVLEEETAAQMEAACSFRNVLAHQYDSPSTTNASTGRYRISSATGTSSSRSETSSTRRTPSNYSPDAASVVDSPSSTT